MRVPRSRLHASIHRVDPINTTFRRNIAIRRRRYNANGANAVWHIDGNHKMIRWHFVIHGGIDGFSRTVVFLKCSDNNRALTVLDAFTLATLKTMRSQTKFVLIKEEKMLQYGDL